MCCFFFSYTHVQWCVLSLGVFACFSIFRHAAFLPNPQTHLIEEVRFSMCVGGWRGCFKPFISGWSRIPLQYYIICTCTQFVFACMYICIAWKGATAPIPYRKPLTLSDAVIKWIPAKCGIAPKFNTALLAWQ